MKSTFHRRPGAAVLAVLLLTTGCAQVLDLIGDTKKKKDPPPSASSSLTVILKGLKADLIEQGFAPAEAQSVTDSALVSVRSARLDEADLTVSIPAALEGAERGLNQGSLSTDQKIKGVETTVSAFVTGLSGNFEATSRSIRSLRALAPNAQVVSDLLARISKVAVSNLAATGIEPERLGETAGGVVSNMIGSLAEGGVNKALVSEALAQITQNAVASLKDAGLEDSEALALAVSSVTKGAVEAVSTIQVEGVSSADFGALTSSITSGASEALGKISGSVDDVALFVRSVAQGSSEGIIAVAATLDTETVAQMVQSATSGATEGVMKSDFVNADTNASQMIGAITSSASQTLALSTTIDQTAVREAVTVGAASAAQTSLSGGMTTADLLSAIQLKDSTGTAVSVDSTSVEAGVELGNNAAPVVSAGDDVTVAVQTSVNLVATATDDHDATLTYTWSLVTKPTTSQAVLEGKTSAVSFTPDVPGTYVVSVRVADSLKASTEVLVSVYAIKNAATTTFEGMTASARLEKAIKLVKSGDLPEARNEFLTILNRYPETSATGETLFRLAQLNLDLGRPDLALVRFQEGMALVPATVEVGARGRLALGWFLLNNKGDNSDDTKALFQSVADGQPGTPWYAEALHGLANIRRNTGDPEGAIGDLKAILALKPINPDRKFWVACDIGWALNAQQKWSEAYTAFKDLDQYVGPGVDASESTLARFYWMFQWWFLGNAQNDPNSGLSQLKEGRQALRNGLLDKRLDANDHTTLAGELGINLMWGPDQNKANYAEALAVFKEASTYKASDTTTRAKQGRAWMALRIGDANRMSRNTATEAEGKVFIDAALAAYQTAKDLGWGKWYGWAPAGYAQIEAAGIYHWEKRDNPKALATVAAVLDGYPSDGDQGPKAFAYFRNGEIYRDSGWEKRDQSGKDWAADFQRGIAAFSKLVPANFPTLNPDEWYFRDAPRQLGDCYIGLRDFTGAAKYFQKDIDNPNLDPNNKAWSQFNLARCYAEQTLQFIRESNFDAANDVWLNLANPAYEAVSSYVWDDGTWVSQGEVWAEALRDKGQWLRNVGNMLRYEAQADSQMWKSAYQMAIETLSVLTPTTFPNLSKDYWGFLEAQRITADCQFGLGQPDEARAALQSLLDMMDAGTLSNKEYWPLRRDLAYSYKREAENLQENGNMPTSQALSIAEKRIALNAKAVDALEALVADWLAKGDSSQEGTVASTSSDEAWALLDTASTLGWRNGYTTSDRAQIDKLQSNMDAIWTRVKDKWGTVDNGKHVSAVARIRGEWYESVRYWKSLSYAEAKASRDTAWEMFDYAVKASGTHPEDLGACLRGEVSILLDQARNETDKTVRVKAFEAAIDNVARLVVDPDLPIWAAANASLELARAYRDLHGANSVDPGQLGGLGITGMDGFNAWRTSVNFWIQPIIDHSGNFSKLQESWLVDEAKRLLGDGSLNIDVQ